MPEIPKLIDVPDGIFSDLSTRNVVLQKQREREDRPISGRKPIVNNTELDKQISSQFENGRMPPEFKFSKEYYEKIKDEKERMLAYKSLVVSSKIIDGPDAEIEKNPWKFLYISKDSDLGDVRVSGIKLSQIWHPDRMDPRNPEKLETVFKHSPFDFPIKGSSYKKWLKELQDFEPKNLNESIELNVVLGAPLSQEQLAKMGAKEKESYLRLHAKHRELEDKAELVRLRMVEIATEKMTVINKAVGAARRKLGAQPLSLKGYDWKETTHAPWTTVGDEFSKWLLANATRRYQDLSLEGNGVIRKQEGSNIQDRMLKAEDAQPVLAFDFGDIYLMHEGYRQYLDLRALFGWMELRAGSEIAPSLLDGVTEIYALNYHQQERLRLMIMNHETSNFIQKALEISSNHFGPLQRFLYAIQEGPTYSHYFGPSRRLDEFALGVEVNSEGELIFKYVHQADQTLGWDADYEEIARFTNSDVQMMRAVAYGPLLGG